MKIREAMEKEGFKELLIKILIFVVAFIAISLVLGPMLVNTVLMSKLKFSIYGGLGYVFLFITIAFILSTREKLYDTKKYGYGSIVFGVISLLLVIAFYYFEVFVKNNPDKVIGNYLLMLGSHLTFLSIFISLALAVFGFKFIKDFVKNFKKELAICIGIAVIFYFSMSFVWKSWEILSSGVSRVVYYMLKLTFDNTSLTPPRTLMVNGFTARIEEACSGVYSIFLFTCLYLFIMFLDWKVINKKKAVFLFLPTVIGLFFVNSLRIYLLMLTGVFISPDFAINMFHSYIGTILFIIYFVLFWLIFYKWMKR